MLKYIFENTEEKWAENLKLLKNSEIRYLLICEAPPFSEIEPPKYFYNYHNKNFNKEIWKTFYPNEIFPNDKEYYFSKLVEVGFLIIDTLPFSMFFQNKRKNKNYYNLLKNSFEWFIEKLNQEELKLSKNLKIAFGFKVNAERFIEITKGNLKLKNNITLIRLGLWDVERNCKKNYEQLKLEALLLINKLVQARKKLNRHRS